MTMGLKIHRMLKEDRKDPPELTEEANRRKELSDSILEIIYNRIMHRGKKDITVEVEKDPLEDDDEDDDI
ncbi:MAG: hypothetical protein ACMUHB_02025 [Thermoplasmatota archaeon]